jgi:hypothetical protein
MLNRLAQNDRKRRGEIAEHGFDVEDKKSGRRWTIHEGDQVIFQRTYRRPLPLKPIRNGVSGTVLSLNGTKAQILLEGNGKRWSKADPKVVTINLRREELEQPIAPNYAMHATRFQGSEVDVALCIASGASISNNNSGYSMLTRAREQAHVFINRDTYQRGIKDLAKAWADPVRKYTAHHKFREADTRVMDYETEWERDDPFEREDLEREELTRDELLFREGLTREGLESDGLSW